MTKQVALLLSSGTVWQSLSAQIQREKETACDIENIVETEINCSAYTCTMIEQESKTSAPKHYSQNTPARRNPYQALEFQLHQENLRQS